MATYVRVLGLCFSNNTKLYKIGLVASIKNEIEGFNIRRRDGDTYSFAQVVSELHLFQEFFFFIAESGVLFSAGTLHTILY